MISRHEVIVTTGGAGACDSFGGWLVDREVAEALEVSLGWTPVPVVGGGGGMTGAGEVTGGEATGGLDGAGGCAMVPELGFPGDEGFVWGAGAVGMFCVTRPRGPAWG